LLNPIVNQIDLRSFCAAENNLNPLQQGKIPWAHAAWIDDVSYWAVSYALASLRSWADPYLLVFVFSALEPWNYIRSHAYARLTLLLVRGVQNFVTILSSWKSFANDLNLIR